MEQFWSLGFQNFLEPEIKLLVSLIWDLGTIALIYVNDGQYYTVSRRASDHGSYAKPLYCTGGPNS